MKTVRIAASALALLAVGVAPTSAFAGPPTLPKVAASIEGATNCAVLPSAKVKCWGDNAWGQLGTGDKVSSTSAVEVQGVSDAVDVAVGTSFACALRSGGTVKCWGSNSSKQLGDGTTTERLSPVSVLSVTDATQVEAGMGHACALIAGGTIKCWGSNSHGQLGDGSFLPSSGGPMSSDVKTVSGITDAVQIAVGNQHSCARLADSTVKCWGSDDQGQLGDGAAASYDTWTPPPFCCGTPPISAISTPVTFISGGTAVDIGAGDRRTCAVISNGDVRCAGRGSGGELGTTTANAFNKTPIAVPGVSNAVTVEGALGGFHSCFGLSGDGGACVGHNIFGQSLDGSTITPPTQTGTFPFFTLTGGGTSPLLTAVAMAPAGIRQIAAGGYHTCVVVSSGKVLCGGLNDKGQRGDGSTPATYSATAIAAEVQGLTAPTDTTPPDPPSVTLTSPTSSPTNSTSATITYSGEAGATFTCSLDGAAYTACPASPVSLTSLGDGSHTYSVKATDAASNTSDAGSVTWTVDATKPTTPTSFTGVPTSPTTATTATIGFTLGESGGTVECRLDSGSWGACTSVSGTGGTFAVSGLSNGSHTISVRQTDSVGNVSDVGTSSSWNVQSPAPAPCRAPTVLTPTAGTKTVYKKGSTWAIRTGLLFSTGGDTRSCARLRTVQVAVDSRGRPVSSRPSVSTPPPSSPSFTTGVVAWLASGEVTRTSVAPPAWVRVGNGVGKWTAWVQLTR